MKNRFWILLILVVLTIAFTGCNIVPGIEEEHTHSVQPLEAANWPTPQPTAQQASPTPFPKITLAPTATPTRRSPEVGTAPAEPEELTFSGDLGQLVQQVTQLSGGFPPAAAALVKTDQVMVRQGPDTASPSLGTAEGGELAAVLGMSEAGDWLYVLTRSALQGWLPNEALQITFSLGEVPTLPPDPTAQQPPQADSSAPGANSFLGGLEPVAVCLITADSVTVRQGPATSYPSAGVLDQGELGGVMGVNATRDWLYVATISGVHGWLPAGTVRSMGSLAEAPVLPATPLTAAISQAVPSPRTDSGALPNSPVDSQPLAPTDLSPIATARVDNAGLNLRQGPGAAYELLGVLPRDAEVSGLALNTTREWLLVKTADGEFGWVSLEYLALDGSLADAPQVISPAPGETLAPGQVAPIFSSSAQPDTSKTIGNTDNAQADIGPTHLEQPSGPSPAAIAFDLSPVTMGHAKRASATLYRGPDTALQAIVTLSIDETVSLLALNQARDWALVKPSDYYKSPGWIPLEDLIIEGSLAEAPRVTTAWVDSNELAVRQGPGIFYDQVGTLAINDMVLIVGLNEVKSWALTQPVLGGGQGWIPVSFLTVAGSWADVPLVAAPPVQPAATSNQSAAPENASAGPGRIVFQLSSGGDIMVVNPDGTGLRRLTHGIDPALSPDGQTVAFTRWTGEDGALWLIDVNGDNERPVLGETKQAKHPSWSPDGQRIVVNFQHEGRLDPKRICENLLELGGNIPDIAWNVDPDSIDVDIIDGMPYLCWTLPPDPHWGLRVANMPPYQSAAAPPNGMFEDVPSDTYAFGPEWDPANPWRIVSSGLNGLVQLDVNRGEQWALTERREDHTPTFSPGGRYIAVAFNNHGHYDIHRLNSDGSGRVSLTQTPLWVTAKPGEQKLWNNVSPAWSPDGSQIAFLTDRRGRWEIWVMNADGSNQRPMFSDELNHQLQITYNFVDERVLSWR